MRQFILNLLAILELNVNYTQFMPLFLSIIICMILLTSWQYYHYKNEFILHYVFCLITVLIYFVKDYPEYLLFFFSGDWLEEWIKSKVYVIQVTEISISGLLILVYTRFFTSFFKIKTLNLKFYRNILKMILFTVVWVLLDWLLLLLVGKIYLIEIIGKTILALISPYFIYQSYLLVQQHLFMKGKEKDVRVFRLIIIGVSCVIVASMVTGLIHIITQDLNRYNLFIPLSVLVDILFFYAAMAYFYKLKLKN